MKKLMLILAMMTGLLAAEEVQNEGLFMTVPDVAPSQGIENGEIVMRFTAERLRLGRAVFRRDSEDEGKFWLELDFSKRADPGDLYVFTIGGVNYRGFVYRGEGTRRGGVRWALGFQNAKKGRILLAQIAKVYALPPEAVIDETAGTVIK